jgi:CheY-like chemotaxis protein
MSTAVERGRASRTCARCGRTGFNAFELVAEGEGPPAWVCTHEGPCGARRRAQWRAGSRMSLGRPRSSPLLAGADDGQQVCVIGGDPDATDRIDRWLRETTPLEVDRLDHSRRSLTRLSHGTYCLVIVDARASDPLAYLNEVSRRLRSAQRSQIPVVVLTDTPQALRPPLAELAERPAVMVVRRPDAATDLADAVESALRWTPREVVLTA